LAWQNFTIEVLPNTTALSD
jgi:hypothetical protein